MPNIGPLEVTIVVVIALIVFGPRKLPELGRGLGTGMREFKDSITGGSHSAARPEESPQLASPAEAPQKPHSAPEAEPPAGRVA